jgi:hypothetical protein
MLRRSLLAFTIIVACTFNVLGDTLKLKDGTSLTGRVIDQGDKYWLKDADGESHFVDKTTVANWVHGDSLPATGGEATSSIPGSTAAPKTAPASANFAAVKFKADRCETAIAATGLWQAYIDGKPPLHDLAAARAELKHWQEVVDGNGEKVNGKWVWGDDHDKLIKQVTELITEGEEAINTNQTLQGIAKFEEAVKIYPNNFDANFELGYFNLVKGVDGGRNNAKIDAGIRSLETAVKLQPQSAATLSDLAIGYSFRQKYELSVETAYQAAKIEDRKDIVQNLVNSISYAPPGMRNNSKIKPIMEEAILLARKYGIGAQATNWEWCRPTAPDASATPHKHGGLPGEEEDTTKGPPGIFANGTGFFISPDGYILTNKHVAKPGDYLMVKLADGSTRLAERIIVDDDVDMAVIKIKVPEEVPFVRLAAYEHPPMGEDVAVFGFPLLSQFGLNSSVKMTRGIVTAWDHQNPLCDVTVDAAVNPGNSGGPMVDHHGNLLALTAMKTLSNTTASSYGLGYSTGRIREFFKRQQARLAAAHLTAGKDDSPVLTNEELATKLTPATVCILICRGTPPTSDGAAVK